MLCPHPGAEFSILGSAALTYLPSSQEGSGCNRVQGRKEHRAMLPWLLPRTWEKTLETIWVGKCYRMAVAIISRLLKSLGHVT